MHGGYRIEFVAARASRWNPTLERSRSGVGSRFVADTLLEESKLGRSRVDCLVAEIFVVSGDPRRRSIAGLLGDPARVLMQLPRFHLFELEDQGWLPGAWRNYATDVLQHMFSKLVDRTVVADKLGELLERMPDDGILDLCSGSSGPLLPVTRQVEARLGRNLSVTLTDKYPNLVTLEEVCAGSEGRATFRTESIDATAVPSDLPGVRTLFAAFHHFRPREARSILADAVSQGRAIAVFEGGERTLKSILMVAFAPLVVFAVTPFLRPRRWARYWWTYIVPVAPFLVVWDGIVSCLRTYTTRELHSLVKSIDSRDYRWEIGRVPVHGIPVGTIYLLGWPESSRR